MQSYKNPLILEYPYCNFTTFLTKTQKLSDILVHLMLPRCPCVSACLGSRAIAAAARVHMSRGVWVWAAEVGEEEEEEEEHR